MSWLFIINSAAMNIGVHVSLSILVSSGYMPSNNVTTLIFDRCLIKLWYIYTMEYYSAIKKNTFESVLMRWLKLEPIIQSEVSQKEKHQYSISSVQFSHSVVSDSLRPHESQHARPPCPSSTPGVHSDSRPSSQ